MMGNSNKFESGEPPGGGHAALGELERQFAAHRRRHPGGSRIPAQLRASVLAAVQRGVSATQLRATCGITANQLSQWRRSNPPADIGRCSSQAQVFSVVDAPSPSPGERSQVSPRPEQALELTVGGWCVSIRQMPSASA